MKTQAAILVEQNKPLVVDDIEVPPLKNGQVLVRVLASGVCRSQLNEIEGRKGPDPYLPHLLGHEGAGIVQEISSGVTKVKPGDFVVLTWIKAKGMDVAASQYCWGSRLVNCGAIATFTRHAVISENRLVKISRKIPPLQAALLGCAIPTGAGMVLNTLNVKKDSSLAVFGVGGIGASAILAAQMRQCANVIGVDVSDAKLAFARRLGATRVLDGRSTPEEWKRALGQGVDFAIESSGNKTAMEQAISAVKDRGTVVIAGNLSKGDKIMIDPFDLIKGKKILGTWGGETDPDRDIPRYARAYLSGTLPLEQLITHRFQLENINQALSILKEGGAGRVMIECSIG